MKKELQVVYNFFIAAAVILAVSAIMDYMLYLEHGFHVASWVLSIVWASLTAVFLSLALLVKRSQPFEKS